MALSNEERLAEQNRLTAMLPEVEQELKKYPGVQSVGVGVKETDGKLNTEEFCFVVVVERKKSPGELQPADMIPKTIKGIKTDVIVIEPPSNQDDSDKYRPLMGGIQIANQTGGTGLGTLGVLAKLNSDNTIVMLSNHHVMMYSGATNGENIGQPSVSCCCCCACNIVGVVINSLSNANVDCAIARLSNNPGFTNEIHEIGWVYGSAAAASGQKVRKRGRTTGLTRGTIQIASIGTPANPPKGVPARVNQMVILPDPGFPKFSDEGDSGSAIVNDDNKVVGLLWGGNATQTVANNISDVTTAMSITIMDTGTAGTIPLSGAEVADPPAATAEQPFQYVIRDLETHDSGRRILELIRKYGPEIMKLINTDRDVKVAWNRYQGPAFTQHVVMNATDHTHPIPAVIKGVTANNLLIRMSVVLQEKGSPELAAELEKHTLTVLNYFGDCTSIHPVIEKVRTQGIEELQQA